MASRGAGPPSVNLELPDISETTTDRKLNLNIWYSTRIGYKNIILYDTSWGRLPYWFSINVYLRGRLRLTTARRLSAYMSSRALATTTTSSYFMFLIFPARRPAMIGPMRVFWQSVLVIIVCILCMLWFWRVKMVACVCSEVLRSRPQDIREFAAGESIHIVLLHCRAVTQHQ